MSQIYIDPESMDNSNRKELVSKLYIAIGKLISGEDLAIDIDSQTSLEDIQSALVALKRFVQIGRDFIDDEDDDDDDDGFKVTGPISTDGYDGWLHTS